MVTIQWLLEQSTLDKPFCCLAGKGGLSNPITGINIMDNPDTVPWLKEHEMVLSTGYIFTKTEIYKNIILNLHKQGCSGLGIKIHRYMENLPKEMLEQANELDFPIFSIPFSSTMEEIVNLVYYEMFRNEMSESEQITLFYHEIMETALKHYKALPVLKKISQSIQMPVFLISPDFQVIEYYFAPEETLSFPFPYANDANYLFPESDRLFLLEQMKNSSLPIMEHNINYQDFIYRFSLFPIIQKKNIIGFFVCLKTKGELQALQYTMISNLQSILVIVMLRNQISLEKESFNQTSFYQKLLSGTLSSEGETELLCKQYGFNYKYLRLCMTVRFKKYHELTLLRQRTFLNRMIEHIFSGASDLGFDVHYTLYNKDLVCFLYPNMDNDEGLKEHIAHGIEHIAKALQAEDSGCVIGYSQLLKGSSTIYQGYMESIRALELGQTLHEGASVFSYTDDFIYHMLSKHSTTTQLYRYYEMILKPLADYDTANDSCLCQTLSEYIACSQNISQAAKNLYIHRNTMIHRMEQIHSLIPLDLRNMDHLYLIQTAFYAKRLLNL